MLSPFLSESCTTDFCTCFYTMIITFLFGYSPDDKFNLQVKPEPEVYDFIIVGAGSAGAVVANRLSEMKKWNVLLLEAGKEEPLLADIPGISGGVEGSEFDWSYKTQREKSAIKESKEINWPRGKIMGGSSSINGMYYVRGNREDFDNWERMGNPGWGYDDVLPYFIKSENNLDPAVVEENPCYHGTGGYLSIQRNPYITREAEILINAYREQGYYLKDTNAENQLGVTITQLTMGNNSRSSTNVAFIRTVRGKRKNLIVKSQSLVTKVVIDPKTRRATGVEYISLKTGESKTATARKDVILSGGVVNSPQLLMVSGVGPRGELKKHNINVIKNLPVGRSLHDHVSLSGLSAKRRGVRIPPRTCEDNKNYLLTYLVTRENPGMTNLLTGFVKTEFEENEDVPDIMFTLDKIAEDEIAMKPVLLTPKSRGYLALNETDPVRGAPLLYPGYFREEFDVVRLLSGFQIAINILNSTVMRRHGFILDERPLPPCQSFKFNSKKYLNCILPNRFNTDFHPVGTCKMGPKGDRTAVVDSRLRVYGIRGLRVIDASIMPAVTRGNTNAPSIMIGEKGSDLIKEDWLEADEKSDKPKISVLYSKPYNRISEV